MKRIIMSHKDISASDSNEWKIGHVAVVIATSRDYIWVMDQNAYVRLKSNQNIGIVGVHKIKFGRKVTDKSDDEYYNNGNAYNYHIYLVEK